MLKKKKVTETRMELSFFFRNLGCGYVPGKVRTGYSDNF
jgi:hypothetical protein